MFESGIRRGAAVTALAVAVAVCGCAAGETPGPTATAPASSRPLPTPTVAMSPSFTLSPTPSLSGGGLIVLADGPDGVRGIWTLDSNSNWAPVAKTPGATALGRAPDGVVLAAGGSVEFRRTDSIATTRSVTPLKWAAAPLAIADVDVSAAGRIALVAADGSTLRYATAGPDGIVTALTPAPTQSFTPLVAWMGETALLVLSTDEQQVSKLAVMETAIPKATPVDAPSGVRVFAVSGDGHVIGAATASGIYVSTLAGLTAADTPAPIASLAEGQVVWALAMDGPGARIWMLSGKVGSDGSVGSVRELGYAKGDAGWQKTTDLPVPFGRGLDQVYVP